MDQVSLVEFSGETDGFTKGLDKSVAEHKEIKY